jgi:molybdenum cofactor synthesis domain-containing protein
MARVAGVIIGDEILTGKFADENGPHLIRRCRELGADLVRLAVIGDAIADIASEVARARESAEWVITTGGVGPTHDDRTFEGIAAALGRPLEQHPRLVALLDTYGLPRSEAALRMATVPRGAELLDAEGSAFPVVHCDGVLVFPGVPALFKSKLEQVAERLRGPTVFTARHTTQLRETVIAAALGRVADEEPSVSIGSYPRFGERPHRVIVTLESRDEVALERASDAVGAALAQLVALEAKGPSEIVDGVGEPSVSE